MSRKRKSKLPTVEGVDILWEDSPVTRQIVEHNPGGLSVERIAALLQWREEAVETTLYRALYRLRHKSESESLEFWQKAELLPKPDTSLATGCSWLSEPYSIVSVSAETQELFADPPELSREESTWIRSGKKT